MSGPKVLNREPIETRLLVALRSGDMDTTILTHRLRSDRTTVLRKLNELEAAGRVVCLARGGGMNPSEWALVAQP